MQETANDQQDATPRMSGQQSGKRMPELDGLRGIAILLVFFLHYITDSRTHEGNFGLLYHLAQVFRLGWSGVDLFFVLSGFLIGGILLDAKSSLNYFRTFYVRRVHRILPIYYAWILVYSGIGLAVMRWGSPSNSTAVGGYLGIPIYLLFLQNILATPGSMFAAYFMSPTWSLAVEEQFYLVSPLVIRFLSVRRLTQVLIGCVVCAPILRYLVYAYFPNGVDKSYVLMPCRADTLAMGMLAAVVWRTDVRGRFFRNLRIIKGLALVLLAGALAMVKWMPGPRNAFEAAMQYSWLGMLYTSAVLIALLDGKGLVSRVARWRFLRECGRVSYCVYLIHRGILGLCFWILFHSLPYIDALPGMAVTLLAAVLTWAIASLSWRFLEQPLIHRGHSYVYRYRAQEAISSK